ncbi:ATP-binding protein [Lentzea sp. NPDC060358]|uniref:ATP-binding protein n=1 Tax=Lentzea sp. NPDC060358 TaxID=3347103 RepID=UPI003666161A
MEEHVQNEVSGDVHGTVVQVRDIYLYPPVPTALAGLPLVATEFTGRSADLSVVAEALSSPQPVVVSTGLAGVGKTTLVVKAAHNAVAEGRFPGGVLFIDLQGYSTGTRVEPLTALSVFLGALGVLQVPASQQEREMAYRSRLAGHRPMLIVLDNASTADQVRPLLPPGGQHRVLVTSRHTLGDLHGARRITIDVLSAADSVAMLENLLRAADPMDTRLASASETACEIADLCGRLPLALGIVAALLSDDPGLQPGEVVALLRETRLNELRYDENLAVRSAFDLSHNRLPPAEQRLFRLLSLNPGRQISTDAAAALAGQPLPATRRLLAGLRRAHMIENGDPHGWFRFHDLLRLYAAERVDSESDEERGGALARLVCHYVTAAELSAQQRPVKETRGQAQRWLQTERPNLVGAVGLAHRLGRCNDVLRLAFAMGTFLFYRRRNGEEGLAAFDLALDAAVQLGDRDSEAKALRGLGRIYREMNHYTAARVRFDAAVVLSRELGDSSGEGRALHNLAALAKQQNNFRSAWKQYRRALAVYRDAGERVGEAQVYFNMGALAKAQEESVLASAHFLTCAEISAEIGRHELEGRAHKRIALIALDADDRETALKHLDLARATYLNGGEERRAQLLRPLFRKAQRRRSPREPR